jgi:hypothetical protein
VLCESQRGAKPVQTFDELRHKSAKHATKEERAMLDEVFESMKSEFAKKENTVMLKAKRSTSRHIFTFLLFKWEKKLRINLNNLKETRALGLEDRRVLSS